MKAVANFTLDMKKLHFKDVGLDNLAEIANVAQFISFDSRLKQRYSRINGHKPNHIFDSIETAIEALFKKSPERQVNIRSYLPESPESHPFIKGLRKTQIVVDILKDLAGKGLYTIVNERINEKDGGVSGVVHGDTIEFAPDVIPRGVDDPKVETVTLPRQKGIRLLKTVYGFMPELDYESSMRVEFSVHPLRRGYCMGHTTVWEIRDVKDLPPLANISWPNNFSRKIGDKAFGLLIADLYDLPVPSTTVIPRKIAPFNFGRSTGTNEVWLRTCPAVMTPGKYTTTYGWADPYKLLIKEDNKGTKISSILSQESVEAIYSGSLLTDAENNAVLEGVKGFGDKYMIGKEGGIDLPGGVKKSVLTLHKVIYEKLGSYEMEWVYDGKKTWLVQLHLGKTQTSGNIVYPGNPEVFHLFEVEKGLSELRKLIAKIKRKREGIILLGNVGVTSHMGQELRLSKISSRIEKKIK